MLIFDRHACQDVMLVGEPTLMGGELGDEDERLITRLENTQYKPVGDDDVDFKPLSHQPSGQPVPMYPAGQPNACQQPDGGKGGVARAGEPGLPSSNG